ARVSSGCSGSGRTLVAPALPPVTFSVSLPAGRVSGSDQFTASIAYTSPAATIRSVTTGSGATSATTGATSVIGTNSITLSAVMAAGSFSALSTYSGSVSCSNSGPGASAWGGTNTVLPGGAGTSFTLTPQTGDNITCTLTLTPPPQTIAGTVYNDANHNGALDAGESGTGISGLYVKLASDSGGTCQSPATAAAAVGAASGAYALPGVPAGDYCLILSGNNTLTDVSAALPAGWIGTQSASGVIHLTVIASGPPPPQNFGLVPANTFGPSGAQTAQAGTTLFYAHAVVAGSAGTVTLSASSSDSPSAPAWNQVLYQDSNCNGVLDTGEPQVSGALTMSAG